MDTTHKKVVLVVDDEPALRNTLAEELKERGYEVLVAKNGEEAWEIGIKEKPDLVTLDLMMPIMDGLATMKRIRTDEAWGKHVPIIILTNLSPEDAQSAAVYEHEPAHYLVKSEYALSEIADKAKAVLDPAHA
jgi:CheY-like chemotaxis protein